MGRGRGWVHCAFSCFVSADGSCWALCCIPLAPHWWQGARASQEEHHSSVELFLSQAILLLVQPVPSISSHSQSHHWPLHGPAGSCWRTTTTSSLGGAWPAASGCRVGCKATRLHPRRLLDASSASLQAINWGRWKEALQLEDVALTEWEGTDLWGCQQFPQPDRLLLNEHLQTASKSHLGLSFRHFSQGKDTLYNKVTTWSTHCIPQGPSMKTGLGCRAQLQAPLSLRVLRFAAPSLGLSGLTKAKVKHRSPIGAHISGMQMNL